MAGLHVLGLDADEEAVYRRLLDGAPAGAAEVAAVLDRAESDVRGVLDRLCDRGLAGPTAADRDRVVPAPPHLALAGLATAREAELRRAQALIAELAARYRAGAHDRAGTDVVDVVVGVQAVAARFTQLQESAASELLTLVSAPATVVSGADNDATETAARARGVCYRVVLDVAALRRPGMAEAIAAADPATTEVRVADTVPTKLVVADRRLALVPLADRDSAAAAPVGALLVHPSGLLDALVATFELVWHAARPATTAAGTDPLAPAGRRVLPLLLAGLTDQAIAGQLGTSERTVQRHVRALMRAAGVESRFQLGWHAARAGWL